MIISLILCYPGQVEGMFTEMAKKKFFLVIFSLYYVWNSINILVCMPTGKRKPPAGDEK